MKKLFLLAIIAFLSLAIVNLSGCKKDDDPVIESEMERVGRLLTTGGTWNLQSVTVDGVDQSGLFSGMTLSFTSNSFTASNGGLVWPSSGAWSFTDNSGQVITRGDAISVAINEISETVLRLTLTWDKTTLGPGKTNSVKGTHVFVLGR